MDFRRNTRFEDLAKELIDTETCLVMLRSANVKVVVIMSDKGKLDETGNRIYADCEKIPPKFMWATDADVMITVYELNIAGLTEQQKRIVIMRELMKIHCDESDGKRKIKIIDFDLKDFKLIVDRYGVNWDKETDLFTEVGE